MWRSLVAFLLREQGVGGSNPLIPKIHYEVEILVNLLRENAIPPSYQSEHAAGLDLCACLEAPLCIKSGEAIAVPTGIAIAIDIGFEGQIRSRSGLALHHNIIVPNSPGTIDSDYRGEVKVILLNLGKEDYLIQPNERIAQLVIAPVYKVNVQIVMDLPETERGKGGFGSSGKI